MNDQPEESLSILDLIPDIIYRLDPTGIITYISNSITVYGYTVDELIGRSIFEIVHPEDRDRARFRINERRVGERSTRYFEVRLLTKDQKAVPFEISTEVDNHNPVFLLDAKGLYSHTEIKAEHFWGTLGIAKNITERKQAEEAIRKSEAIYRSLVEDMPALVCRFKKDGTLTFINNAYCTFFKKTQEELIDHKLFECIPKSGRAIVREHIRSLSRNNPIVTYEHEVVCPDGTIRALRWTDRLLFDQEGKPMEYQSIGIDITERRQVEQLLTKRLRYEKGLALISKALLEENEAENTMTEALGYLLDVSGVSRVYIFENFEDPEDGLCNKQTYEVCAHGITPQIDNPFLKHVPYKNGFTRWQKILSKGDSIMGLVESFPLGERHALEAQDIKSILILPFTVSGNWYGFIGFDDAENSREWNEEDIRLLRLAAELIGSYFERKKMEENMHVLATRDGLTGIFNRRYYLDLAEKELARAKRYKRSLSIILFDVDHFKDINDSFGHPAGDEALKELTKISLEQIRDNDFIGRVGGEEFSITLTETDLKGTVHVAERLRKSVESARIKIPDGTSITTTISIGVAEWTGEEELTKLLARSDKMLYAAKNSGRNCVVWEVP